MSLLVCQISRPRDGNFRCDALIIGGGPSGLAAGIALRQRGLDVLVVEALAPPIDKACGEGLMPESRRALSQLGVDLTAGRDFSGIHFANRNDGREDLADAGFADGAGIGIRRLELHRQLIIRAEELGVRLQWSTRASLGAKGEVLVEGVCVRYRYLVGADGEASRVRRWAGLEAGSLYSRRLGFRRHYRMPTWSNRVEVHWGQLGQVYVTPVGEDEVCFAAVTRHHGLNFDRIVEGIPCLAGRLQRGEAIGRDRGAMTTTRRLRRVVRGNVVLVGDASGSVDAITGQGLASAFREALLLGEALGRDSIEEYQAGHAQILRLPQTMASLMLTMDRWPAWRDRVMRTLAGSPELFASLLAVHAGERSLRQFAARYGLELGMRLLIPQRGKPVSAGGLA